MNVGIGWLRNFKAKIGLVFRKEHVTKNYRLFYGIKKFIHDKVNVIPVIENQLGGTLKGRYILEIEVEFYHDKDFELFNGLHLMIMRDEKNALKYPDQKFTFLIKKEEIRPAN